MIKTAQESSLEQISLLLAPFFQEKDLQFLILSAPPLVAPGTRRVILIWPSSWRNNRQKGVIKIIPNWEWL